MASTSIPDSLGVKSKIQNPKSVLSKEALEAKSLGEVFKVLGLPNTYNDRCLFAQHLHNAGFKLFQTNKYFPDIRKNQAEEPKLRADYKKYLPELKQEDNITMQFIGEPAQNKTLKSFVIYNREAIFLKKPMSTYKMPPNLQVR